MKTLLILNLLMAETLLVLATMQVWLSLALVLLLLTLIPHMILHFILKDIVHYPKASTNLLSINKFCRDNKCFFILTDSYFCVKDNKTGNVFLQGLSENGLYPLHFHHSSTNKLKDFTAFLGVKTTDLVWHNRLGHPSESFFFIFTVINNFLFLLSSINLVFATPVNSGNTNSFPFPILQEFLLLF